MDIQLHSSPLRFIFSIRSELFERSQVSGLQTRRCMATSSQTGQEKTLILDQAYQRAIGIDQRADTQATFLFGRRDMGKTAC
jgi:hypothetical protein